MLNWLPKRRKSPGRFAISLGGDMFDYVYGQPAEGGKSVIASFGSRPFDREKHGAEKLARELRLEDYQCSTMLRPGEYQMLLVEAPNVPPEELKSAIRWRVKDMLDYHVDDATLDVLAVPPEEGATARARMMYAIAARNDVIQEKIKNFDELEIPLSVIEIPETVQRNLAELYEQDGRGAALTYFGEEWGLLTINYRGELMFARRFDVGLKQLCAPSETARTEAIERVVLELQRTFDHFDRQFRYVPLGKLLVAPTPEQTELATRLAAGIGVPVENIDLRNVLGFEGAGPDQAMQWRLFMQIGATLRREAKAI
jgi:MSHA biogenesis protein MshI